MGAAASSRAAADARKAQKNAMGRHVANGPGSGDDGVAPAKAVAPLLDRQDTARALPDAQSTGKHRRSSRRDKGDKRATASADGVLRRVRSKRRHVASDAQQRQTQPAVGTAQPGASANAFVSLRGPEGKKAAAVPLSSSPEVAEVFRAATLPVMHLSVRTRRDPGDVANRRRHRQRSEEVAAASPPQPQSAAQAAVAHAVARATLRRGSKSSSSSGDGGRSSMAATVHSLGRSLRRISIASGSPVKQRHQLKAAAATACTNAVSRMPNKSQTAAGSGTLQPPPRPETPSTDAGSCNGDTMSTTVDLHLHLPPQQQPCSSSSPPAVGVAAAAAPQAQSPAAAAAVSPASHGTAGGPAPRQRPPYCSHPLDGTPRSLVRHPLQRTWPSSGRLSARMRTVSTDSTWLLPLGAAAAADDSASEWSALEVRATRERLGYDGQLSDDSDSDSEFWGGLAARVAAAKRQRDGPPAVGTAAGPSPPPPASDMEARSLAYSRAVAAAQHPVFNLSNPEEAVMAQNAALYRELLR